MAPYFFIPVFLWLSNGVNNQTYNNDSIETEYLIEGQSFLSNELCWLDTKRIKFTSVLWLIRNTF